VTVIESGLSTHDFGEDVIGLGCPDKRLWTLIVQVDIVVQRVDEFQDADSHFRGEMFGNGMGPS
jgi:hypothetical protein